MGALRGTLKGTLKGKAKIEGSLEGTLKCSFEASRGHYEVLQGCMEAYIRFNRAFQGPLRSYKRFSESSILGFIYLRI